MCGAVSDKNNNTVRTSTRRYVRSMEHSRLEILHDVYTRRLVGSRQGHAAWLSSWSWSTSYSYLRGLRKSLLVKLIRDTLHLRDT